ncbi:MAG TPA: hypothetical protein VJ483_01180, partial [Holophagaceae bacterium]|nr:hypothetical protein [Holophagaceae bacterium]
MRPLLISALTLTLAAPLPAHAQSGIYGQAPLRVAAPPPQDLDLRDAPIADLVPRDPRDPAQVEAARIAWGPRVAPVKELPALRLVLPTGEGRVPLLLAAAQALRAQSPEQKLFVAFDAAAQPVLDEAAWGAVDGGALMPADLGQDPAQWRGRLEQAMNTFPGRPWTLWCPSDPGALASLLMGDGGRLVVPSGGPTEALLAKVPAGYSDVEGGLGDLTLRNAATRSSLRWRFVDGAWVPAELPKGRTEVAVNDRAAYDVGALLARLRAFQLRSRAAARTLQMDVEVDLRLQSPRGEDQELGFRFKGFERAGEPLELLQKAVLFNGVKAKLDGEIQLPVVESRTSLALPGLLSLNERYRYEDGGAAGPGRRRLRFAPVDKDPLLYSGELLVEEATGRVLQEIRERSRLPGTVREERVILDYGELTPGLWRPVKVHSFERWMGPRGLFQVQRGFSFKDAVADGPDFEARRAEARGSKATMLVETPQGTRYFTRQEDGTRKIEEKPKTSGRALAGILLFDPGLPLPVVPAGGLALFNFDAFGKGIQTDAIIAGIFNTASAAAPHLPLGFDATATATALLLKVDERPVKNGRLAEQDAVSHAFGHVHFTLGHDLGLGFRLEGGGEMQYDRYGEPRDDKYATPGFAPPPSGWTREATAAGSWLFRGFQLRAYTGWGRRPDGTYGTAADPQAIPDEGRYRLWGGSMSLSRELTDHLWFKGEVDFDGGTGFDRFKALQVGGGFGGGGVPGIRSNALTADRLSTAKVGLSLPPTAGF